MISPVIMLASSEAKNSSALDTSFAEFIVFPKGTFVADYLMKYSFYSLS